MSILPCWVLHVFGVDMLILLVSLAARMRESSRVSQQVGKSPQGYTISHTWQNSFEVNSKFQSGAAEGLHLFKLWNLRWNLKQPFWCEETSWACYQVLTPKQFELKTQLMGLSSIVMSLIGPMNGVFEITSDLTGWMNIELNLDQVSSWCKISWIWIEMESMEFQ